MAKRRYLFKVGAVKDLAFNAISSDAFTLFETGAGFEDDSPPTLVAQYPPAGSVNIPTNVQVLLLFDEPLDARTVSGRGADPRLGRTDAATQHLSQFVSQNMGGLYQIGVFGRWPPSQTLTVQIPALKDLSGAVRSPSQFSFATGPDPANVRPQVTSIVPADGARDVPLTASVQVTVAPPALAGSVFQESSVVTITLSEANRSLKPRALATRRILRPLPSPPFFRCSPTPPMRSKYFGFSVSVRVEAPTE